MIKVKFVHLHTPFLLAGKNFPDKIETKNFYGKFFYNTERHELIVIFKGEVAVIPQTNIVFYSPHNIEDIGLTSQDLSGTDITPVNHPVIQKSINAQVSTPTSHVFEKGAGKTKQ